MRISFWAHEAVSQGDSGQPLTPQRQPRRGATALEYLVCISTILVVVIVTIQHLGSLASGMFANNAKATSNTIKGP